jgi:hypothetical protein
VAFLMMSEETMTRIPETKPGHLAQFGPLNHQRSKNGPRKGGAAYQFKKAVKDQPAPELGWETKK